MSGGVGIAMPILSAGAASAPAGGGDGDERYELFDELADYMNERKENEMKKMMMRMLVMVLLAMAWFEETHANPIVVPPSPPSRYVTVKFDANGGTVDEPSIRLRSGMRIGEATEPVRDGYRFAGWYTERTGGWRITPDSVISAPERDSDKMVEPVTVYAHWRMLPACFRRHIPGTRSRLANPIERGPERPKKLPYDVTVKFDANGGTVNAPSIRLRSGMRIGEAIDEARPVRVGYEFKGWYTERTGGWMVTCDSMISAPERDGDKTVAQTVTVYAHWAKETWRWEPRWKPSRPKNPDSNPSRSQAPRRGLLLDTDF